MTHPSPLLPPAPGTGSRVLLAVALLVLAGPARSLACGFPPGMLPPGSYLASCSDCTVEGTTLRCDCFTIQGALVPATLAGIDDCRSQPANTNGTLVCDRCSAIGACCREGVCAQESFSDCTSGGSYHGDGKACGQVMCPVEPGETIAWIAAAGGDFGTVENWDPAEVPHGQDHAHFEVASTFDVDLGGARTIARALVRTSLMRLLGGTLTLTGGGDVGLTLGGGARLTLAGATVQSAGVRIGDVALGPASALVVPASGVLTATGTASVGDAAPGVLDVTGGTVTLGTTGVGGPEDTGGMALADRGPRRAGPLTAALPESAGGKLLVRSGGNATLASLALGASGVGLVDVRAASRLTVTGDARIGVAPGPGFAVVDGVVGTSVSTWQSNAALLIGTNAEGTFDVLGGASVRATSLELGVDPGGTGALTVAETAPTGVSKVEVSGLLAVGSAGVGTLTLTNGKVTAGDIRVARTEEAEGTIRMSGFAELTAEGVLAVGIPGSGRLEIDGGTVRADVLAVGAFDPNEPSLAPKVVTMTDGSITADVVIVGNVDPTTGVRGAFGTLTLAPGNGNGNAFLSAETLLDLRNGEVVIERGSGFVTRLTAADVANSGGRLAVRAGGAADLGSVALIGAPGNEAVLEVDDGTVRIAAALDVGDELDPTQRGRVQLAGTRPLEVGRELFVGPGGVIAGTGVIRIGPLDVAVADGTLTNLGLIAPGSSPGTLAVEGDLVQGPAGTLVVEIGGAGPGAFDVLSVSGDVQLGGTLVLRFVDGYLPQPGDAFPFLTGTKVKGSFAAVVVDGVGPGFDFTLAPAGGTLALTALSAAEAPPCRDAADADGDGATCADTCPALANPDQADADGDALGDACDPCTDGAPLAKPVLGLKKEKLALKGTLSIPGAPLLTPVVTGARVTIEDATGAVVATLDAPPGAFDAATKTGWKKLAYASRTGALRALKLGQAKRKPGTITLAVKGVLAGVDATTLALPLTARVLLAPASVPTSLCGQAAFVGPAGVNPLCTLKRGALQCRAQKRR